ncbi:uncharacterized protein TNCV_1235911 [Trichonephila clavipes]|nr:uncharacterized protein TNCV_1235911 [Trichonephila clavipes]
MGQNNFHLFRYLKEFLGGKRFDTANEVKEVQDWLSSQAADVYEVGIQKLVERYDKCLNKHGNNVGVTSLLLEPISLCLLIPTKIYSSYQNILNYLNYLNAFPHKTLTPKFSYKYLQ